MIELFLIVLMNLFVIIIVDRLKITKQFFIAVDLIKGVKLIVLDSNFSDKEKQALLIKKLKPIYFLLFKLVLLLSISFSPYCVLLLKDISLDSYLNILTSIIMVTLYVLFTKFKNGKK